MEKGLKVLTVSDFGVKTGFARVMESLVNNFPENYDIYSLAINYRGDYYNTRAKLFPAMSGGDLYGIGRIKPLVEGIKPDIILILQDSWIVEKYLEQIEDALDRTIIYTPVDAGPYLSKWTAKFNKAKKICAYTNFGRDVLINSNPLIEDIKIIPHGIDTTAFFPIDKVEARKNIRRMSDEFIVLNYNRNQPRKKLDVALKGFSIFAEKHDDARYYHHAGVEDTGWNIIELSKRYGVEDKLILTSMNTSPTNGISDKALNIICNVADVGINTSLGEGWGLCVHPDANIITTKGYKRIADVEVGDKVFDASGLIQEVKRTYKRRVEEDLVEIKVTKCYRPIVVTKEHPIFTKNGFKQAKDITEDDYIYSPYINLPVFNGRVDFANYCHLPYTDKYMYISGKGFNNKISSVKELEELRVLLNSNIDKNDYKRFSRFVDTTSTDFTTFIGYIVAFSSKLNKLYRTDARFREVVFKLFGYVAKSLNKDLYKLFTTIYKDQSIYLQMNRKALLNVLNTIIENKSYYNKNNYQYTIAFRNVENIYIVELILSQLSAHYSQFQIKNDGTVYFVLNRNIFKVSGSSKTKKSHNKVDDLLGVYCKVINVDTVPYSGNVYNLEVEDSHTYLVEGYAVHNCNFEHACTMRPQIVPYNSANIELFAEGRGIFMSIDHTEVLPGILTEGKAVSPEEVADKLEYVYNNREDAQTCAINAYNYFTGDKFKWSNIANQFVEIFEQ